MAPRTYTHPDVLTIGVRDGWADPETDPTRIDWSARQARAAIPFAVVDGRPVNPCETTAVRYGRNELGHWGEALAADALVSATDRTGRLWIVMVERDDGHGWALPGGHVDPGETQQQAALRELAEETGLTLPGASWQVARPRYVPDPRASDEAWMVTVLCTAHLGTLDRNDFPAVAGGDDAARAEWVRADTYRMLTDDLAGTYGGQVFPAHVDMLKRSLFPVGLHALADWMTANEVIGPKYGTDILNALGTNTEVEDFAARHGLKVDYDDEGNAEVTVSFGPITYKVYGYVDFAEHCHRLDERGARRFAAENGLALVPVDRSDDGQEVA
jgi:ADP-ribose pyrophosphatase